MCTTIVFIYLPHGLLFRTVLLVLGGAVVGFGPGVGSGTPGPTPEGVGVPDPDE